MSEGNSTGSTLPSLKTSTITLDSHLTIHNVLYVSDFLLVQDLDCVLIFSSQNCLIQDRITRIQIGVDELRDRVYYLRVSMVGVRIFISVICLFQLFRFLLF